MLKQTALGALLLLVVSALGASGAFAGVSIVCDEKAQIDAILSAGQRLGFAAQRQAFLAFLDQRNDRGDPACELSEPPQPGLVGDLVSTYEDNEFRPGQSHEVDVFEIHVGPRVVFGSANRYVGPRGDTLATSESGL